MSGPNWRGLLPSDPKLWTWAYDYDTYHLGAVDASIQALDDTCGFEIAVLADPTEVEARFSELRADGWPEEVLLHAKEMYDAGIKLGTLGTFHKPTWER